MAESEETNRTPTVSARFMIWSTFSLGGWWGIVFAVVYFAEFALLLVNPLHVMGVSESKVLAYLAFRDSPSVIPNLFWWDLACWIMDFKKISVYLLLSFWVLTYASIVTPPDDTITWKSTKLQRQAVQKLTSYTQVPFVLNLLFASVLTALLSGAAIGILGPDDTAIWRPLYWNVPWHHISGFVLYRLVYVVLLLVVCLHMTIGFQSLLGRVLKRQARRAVSKYFLVVICYSILIIVLETLLWKYTMGRADRALFRLNIPQYFLLAIIFYVFAILFFVHHQGQRDEKQEAE